MLHQEKKTETKEVTTVTREWKTCDICGATISPGPYEVEETEVSMKVGTSYPEGGSSITTEVDLCQKCFTEKLIPWLRSHGAEPRSHEVDW